MKAGHLREPHMTIETHRFTLEVTRADTFIRTPWFEAFWSWASGVRSFDPVR